MTLSMENARDILGLPSVDDDDLDKLNKFSAERSGGDNTDSTEKSQSQVSQNAEKIMMEGESEMKNDKEIAEKKALQNSEELIREEELEKDKAERKRAKKRKTIEENPSSHASVVMDNEETPEAEEESDIASAFVANVAKKIKVEREESRLYFSRRLADRGDASLGEGRFYKAIALYSESIKLDPSNHWVFGQRSYCFEKTGEFQKALKDAAKSVALCPHFREGYYRGGKAYMGLKEYALAENCYMKVLELDENVDEKRAVELLRRIKVIELTEMGYSRKEAKAAIARHGTIENARKALEATKCDRLDVFHSDEEIELLALNSIPSEAYDNLFHFDKESKRLVSSSTPPQAYEDAMKPSNPEGYNSVNVELNVADMVAKEISRDKSQIR